MNDFLWKKVSEKEKKQIEKKAKEILDNFSKKLEKFDIKEKEPLIKRTEFERTELELKKPNNFSREIMFKNADEKNKDFIITEKKKW